MPGFVDIHTHYDAELIAAPALTESVRHGVTTVTVGSCSISAILSDPDDCSDLFTRVEAVPRAQVLPLLRRAKTWNTPREYVDFLRSHPLGPNVTSFMGHSDLPRQGDGARSAPSSMPSPTEAELVEMERWLGEALDCGLLGMSTMTNKWDKLDGDRFRSHPLPRPTASARVSPPSRGASPARPNPPGPRRHRDARSMRSCSCSRRPASACARLSKATLITMADAKSSSRPPSRHRGITRFVNRVLRGDMRWQTLPVPFEVYADGVDLVVFEESAPDARCSISSMPRYRNELMTDEAYRRKFRRLRQAIHAARVAPRFRRRARDGMSRRRHGRKSFGGSPGRAASTPSMRFSISSSSTARSFAGAR